MEIEKNDVDISKLFVWGKKFMFETVSGKTVAVYIRLVGDADVNKARVFALRKSAEFRAKLKEQGSDEHVAFILPKSEQERERLLEGILVLLTKDFTHRALREVSVKIPKEPHSDAPLEEFEKFQKEVDEYPEKFNSEIEKFVEKEVRKKRKELEKNSVDELFTEYETEVIKDLCENEMIRAYRDYCAYAGAYSDKEFKTRFFKSLEEFLNLPTEIKAKFVESYTALELAPDELKKSPEATQ